ncbi:MAG TPA: hypothetical protein VLI67_01310 [Vicinamibacteria bacterium]|nr:hypothetical protein [Vicinamibacteria bacterium]
MARSLAASSFFALAFGVFLNARGRVAGGPDVLSWVAAAYALVATVGAVWLRGRGPVAPRPGEPASPRETAAPDRNTLVFFAILESAVVLCALALIVSRPALPFAAALVPFGVMVLNLPRRDS